MWVIPMNIAPIPINTFATLPACVSRSPVLGAPGPILQPDIRPTKRLFDLMKRHSVSEDAHGDRANNTRCKSTVPGLPVLRAVPQGEHGGERQTGDDAASESRIGRPAAIRA